MITIERPFSTQTTKSNLITFLVFFGVMSVVGLLFNLIPTELWNRPVSEALFGKSFLFYHFFPLLLFAGIFFFGGRWIKKSGHTHPSIFLVQQEQQEFQTKYNQDGLIPVYSSKKFVFYMVIFLGVTATLIKLPWMLGMTLTEKGAQNWSYAILGLAGFVYIGYLTRYMQGYHQYMTTFLEKISSRLGQTQLKTASQGSTNISGNTNASIIEGQFKGYQVELDFHTMNPGVVKNYAYARMKGINTSLESPNLSYKAHLKLEKKLKSNFKLQDKEADWKKIEAPGVEEAFHQRFELQGNPSFSSRLKKKLVEYPRNIVLEGKGNELIFSSDSREILPYYSLEGVILFLDFLHDIAKEIQTSDDY